MRRDDVARLAGVAPNAVQAVAVSEVWRCMRDCVPAVVLAVATQNPAWWWRVGESYYLDDPFFGPVVAITDLDYNAEIGLHPREATP